MEIETRSYLVEGDVKEKLGSSLFLCYSLPTIFEPQTSPFTHRREETSYEKKPDSSCVLIFIFSLQSALIKIPEMLTGINPFIPPDFIREEKTDCLMGKKPSP